MTIRRRVLTFLLIVTTSSLYSQESDFGVWYNASIEYDLTKKIEIQLDPALRTYDKASKIEEFFLETELSYKITKFISVAGSYRITNNIEEDGKFHLRHKWYAGVKGSVDIWIIDLSGRLRFERRYKTYFEDEEDKIPDSYTRLKAKAVFKTPSFPLNPYISAELFFPVNKEPDNVIDKKRFAGGVRYKVSKNHHIDLEYMFQRDFHPRLKNEHIVSVGYKLEFYVFEIK